VSEFDRYGNGEYERALAHSLAISGREPGYYAEAKAEAMLALVWRRLGDPSTLSALDVGAGTGLLDDHLRAFSRLVGLDVSAALVKTASERNPGVEYVTYDGGTFPFNDGEFNFVFASCVLHHVPLNERDGLVREMARVTKPNGIATVIEHNPFNPATRLVVARCEFDEDAILLRTSESRRLLTNAGLVNLETSYILFFPFRTGMERRLRRLPIGAQYYVAGTR